VSEQFYDEHIAPKLVELAKQCYARGMSFVACVEHEPGKHGGTYFLTERASLEMQMIFCCARTAPNVDAYMIWLARHAKETGIDTGSSIVMRMMEPRP